LSELFLSYYRNEFNRIKDSKEITFPLENKEKTIVYLFRYLAYISLPLIIILSIQYEYKKIWDIKEIIVLFTYLFIVFIHAVVTIIFFIRMYNVRKKFNSIKKEQKSIIKNALIDHFSKEITLQKKDELTNILMDIKLNNSKEYKELKTQFEKKLGKEKKSVTFNYPILSIIVAISIATFKPISSFSSMLFLILIIMIILTNIAIYSFYKDYYKKYYLPVEEELEDITDFLQELVIYKTACENNHVSVSQDNAIKILKMVKDMHHINKNFNTNIK